MGTLQHGAGDIFQPIMLLKGVKCPLSGGYPVETTVTYTCGYDYGDGVFRQECQQNGQWDFTLPECGTS